MVRLSVLIYVAIWLVSFCNPGAAQNAVLSKVSPIPAVPFVGFVINDGDSLFTTAGSASGVTITTYLWNGGTAPNSLYRVTAINGTTTTDDINNFSQHVTPVYNAIVQAYGGSIPVLIALSGGANDIRAGSTAAAIYANYQTYINLVHALGANAKMLIPAIPLQCDILNNATFLAKLQQLNNLIYANWNVSQGSGGLGADGLVDFFGNTTVGMNTYASSAFCNATYSTDGQHGTDLTKSILGPVEGGAVTPFLLH